MFWNWFRKEKKEEPPSRFPTAYEDANEWMNKVVDYWDRNKKDDLYFLFSPASADYLPMNVFIGHRWHRENLIEYRKIKSRYPEAVEKAHKHATGIAGSVSLSRIGDPEDY